MTARMHNLAVIVCDIEDCHAYWVRTQGRCLDDSAVDGWSTEFRGGAHVDFCPDHSDLCGAEPDECDFRATVYYEDEHVEAR